MTIQPINNVSFGTRVRINRGELADIAELASMTTPVISGGVASSAGLTGSSAVASASNIVGLGSEVVGSAFSAKASGLGSSGIVPAVMESATPYVTPATIATSNNHPSIMGSLLSTVGNMIQSLSKPKINNTVKRPN